MLLSFKDSKKLVLEYEIPFFKTGIFNLEKKAIKFAEKIGYPVVLKIFSFKILHRTEVGGVKTSIQNQKELKKAFSDFVELFYFTGFLFCNHLSPPLFRILNNSPGNLYRNPVENREAVSIIRFERCHILNVTILFVQSECT